MNEFLPNEYDEIIHRLALGIEPIDGQQGGRLSYELQIQHEETLAGLRRPPIERHHSNLFSLRYQPGIKSPLALRMFDTDQPSYKPESDRRRVVPRRFLIPVLTRTAVENQERADRREFRRRIRRPVFFAGAAYDLSASATALRGHVWRNNQPMRWARVVARLAGQTVVLGRAHGDNRGEFLLILNARAVTGSTLPQPLNVDVSISGPVPVPAPASPNQEKIDPLWDLPVETLAAPGSASDSVATGEDLPGNYTATIMQTVAFTLGRCIYREFTI